jgi:hypothetical protein
VELRGIAARVYCQRRFNRICGTVGRQPFCLPVDSPSKTPGVFLRLRHALSVILTKSLVAGRGGFTFFGFSKVDQGRGVWAPVASSLVQALLVINEPSETREVGFELCPRFLDVSTLIRPAASCCAPGLARPV